MEFLIVFTVAFLSLIVTHVMPWRLFKSLVKQDKELHKVPAYTIGVGVMLVIFAVWCMTTNNAQALAVMVSISVGAGLGTTLPRIVRSIVQAVEDAEREANKSRQLEARIREIEEAHGQRPNSSSE